MRHVDYNKGRTKIDMKVRFPETLDLHVLTLNSL